MGIEEKLVRTRAAISFLAALIGFLLAAIGIQEYFASNHDGAALWIIASLLTRLEALRG